MFSSDFGSDRSYVNPSDWPIRVSGVQVRSTVRPGETAKPHWPQEGNHRSKVAILKKIKKKLMEAETSRDLAVCRNVWHRIGVHNNSKANEPISRCTHVSASACRAANRWNRIDCPTAENPLHGTACRIICPFLDVAVNVKKPSHTWPQHRDGLDAIDGLFQAPSKFFNQLITSAK